MPVRFGKGSAKQPRPGQRLVRRLGFAYFFFAFFFALPARACPGILLAKHLPFLNPDEVARHQLALYAYDGDEWKERPLQIDPLDGEGSLLFPKDRDWRSEKLRLDDRFSFRVEDFGSRYDGAKGVPCRAKELLEISFRSKYAYLASCPNPVKGASSEPISFREAEREVASSHYRYRYSSKNHLVFEDIQLSERGKKDYVSVARQSDLLIVGDVKNFFTLTFDSDDIEAMIKHKRNGPLGFMAGLEFYLRILAFRINMELLPEANFFEDALFMPMSMTLPVNAAKYLRRGSGIYYSWFTEKDAQWDWQDSQIDELDLKQLDPNGKGPFAQPNPRHCNSRYCSYRLEGTLRNRRFVMNFVIARKAADLGFFPQLIRDVDAVEKQLERKISRFPPTGRTAIYFETARLPEGTHTWDFWIYFPDQDASGECRYAFNRRNISHLIISSGRP